jgi:hypothetical protein
VNRDPDRDVISCTLLHAGNPTRGRQSNASTRPTGRVLQQ